MIVMMALLIFNIYSKQTAGAIASVPCIDPSKSLKQNYTFTLKTDIFGRDTPLDPQIGHDPGTCLREIYTNDSSGTVYVKSVTNRNYTLADFLTVFNRLRNNYHIQSIKVNGNVVDPSNLVSLPKNGQVEIEFE